MFQMRSGQNARGFVGRGGGGQVGFEVLETRRLLCGTATSAAVTKAESLAPAEMIPAETIKADVLSKSAVEGHYKGVVDESTGATLEFKIFVTATSSEIVIGSARLTGSLTSAHFTKIRKGTFDVTYSEGADTVTVVATITGTHIKGTYTTSANSTGTFSVVKYAE